MINPVDIGWELGEAFVNFLMEAEAPVVIYGGRFQPFHAGHYSVYKGLVEKYGADRVYIVTSDKTDPEKSPFNFGEKQQVMTSMFGIPQDHVVQVRNVYAPKELTGQFPESTPAIFAVSTKDAERLGTGKYYSPIDANPTLDKGYRERGYYTVVPEFQLSVNGKNISGTTIRDLFRDPQTSEETKQSLFTHMYGKFDPDMYKLISGKLSGYVPAPPKAMRKVRQPAVAQPATQPAVDVNSLMGTRIKNPETGNNILVRTALKYDPTTSVHMAAQAFLKSRNVNESISAPKSDNIKKFIQFVIEVLELEEQPNIVLMHSRDYTNKMRVLGQFDEATNKIYIATHGRLTADILRTIAHELVHRKQVEMGVELDGDTGSDDENQANAAAGIVMRYYGKIEPTIFNESLLKEGGAAGHLAHPYEDIDLTFADLKTMVRQGLVGTFGEQPSEKLDGQNIMFTVRDGQVVFARSTGHIKRKGQAALSAQELRDKFAGRGAIEQSFGDAADDLQAAISRMSPQEQEQMFGGGSKFVNVEIIHPDTESDIPYGSQVLIFHNSIEYDIDGKAIGIDTSAGKQLSDTLRTLDANQQKQYGLRGPNLLTFADGDSDDGKYKTKAAELIAKLEGAQKEYGLGDGSTIGQFKEKKWMEILEKAPGNLTPEQKKLIARRWAYGEKSTISAKHLDSDAAQWFKEMEVQSNFSKYNDKVLDPIKSVILQTGAYTLARATNLVSANNAGATEQLKNKVTAAIQAVKDTGSEKQIAELTRQMKHLQDVGFDSIVPSEGVVFMYNGKPYKFTGAFAPMHQILSIMGYKGGQASLQGMPEPAPDPILTPKAEPIKDKPALQKKVEPPVVTKQRTTPMPVAKRQVVQAPPAANQRGSAADLDAVILNPETQNKIKIRTALQYPQTHPAYKAARQFLAKASLQEGGHQFADATSAIPRQQVPAVIQNGFRELGIDTPYVLVGNTDKDMFNDLDVAIDNSAFTDILGVSFDDDSKEFWNRLEQFSKEKVKAQGRMQKGLGTYSLLLPLPDEQGGYAQVDFMIGRLPWMAKFLQGSNDSKYKGVHRNILFMSILGQTKKPTEQPGVFEKFLVHTKNGMYLGTFREDKPGKKVYSSQELVTADADEAVAMIFGKGVVWDDVNTFEKMHAAMASPGFILKGKEDEIMAECQKGFIASKLPIPSEMSAGSPPIAPPAARQPVAQAPQPAVAGRQAMNLNGTVINPETGNNIQIKTALKYPPTHPAYKLARRAATGK